MKHTKHLRRAAEAMSVGQPYSAYVRGKDGNGILDPKCTKSIYKKLRKVEGK
jgi:hypothetical protein